MPEIRLPPFPAKQELFTDDESQGILDSTTTLDFINKELNTPIFDELDPHLWLVAKKEGSHVDAIHQHIIKRRTITIAEDPGLHLVWFDKTIYIKPLPVYLLNHEIWETYLLAGAAPVKPGSDVYDSSSLGATCLATLGFLRSYAFLIKHPSDFVLAKKHHLIPEHLNLAAFEKFIAPLRSIPDCVVCPRYRYGQIRLARLNWAVRICRPAAAGGSIFPLYYHKQYWQAGQYLERLAAPVLFLFATFSLVLSSMQVVLAALDGATWPEFVKASWLFSLVVMTFLPGVLALVIFVSLLVLLCQFHFAATMHRKDVSQSRAAGLQP